MPLALIRKVAVWKRYPALLIVVKEEGLYSYSCTSYSYLSLAGVGAHSYVWPASKREARKQQLNFRGQASFSNVT